jgi:hypothetical protein
VLRGNWHERICIVEKTNVAAFLAVLVVSAATMVLLFWRFPADTAVVTLGVFRALASPRAWRAPSRSTSAESSTRAQRLAAADGDAKFLGAISDTKAPEDLPQQIVAAEFAGDFAKRPLSEPQILGE